MHHLKYGLTQAAERFDPSCRTSALGAAQFAPASDFGIVVGFHYVIDVLVGVHLH